MRQRASRTRFETTDPELASVLSNISRRRRERGGSAHRELKRSGDARSRTNAGTLLDVQRVGTGVAILRVARPEGLQFRAGQHLKLGFPNGASNPYTIASAPSDPHLEFCIERVPGGRVSSQLFELEPGAHLRVDKPKGNFVLEPAADIHLMFATVTGISPFRSMLREAAATNVWSRFIVVHGASFADELVYRTELEELAEHYPQHVRYLPSVSRPTDPRNRDFDGLSGRLPALASDIVQELQPTTMRVQVYACGNPEMVQAIHTTLGAMNLPVVSEVFD